MSTLFKSFLWSSWSRFEKWAAQSYVVGADLDDALRVCRRLAKVQRATTICHWTADEESPQHVAAAYLDAMHALTTEKLDCYLSIKAPNIAFNPQFLAPLIERGRDHDVRLHFDSLAPDTADKTFDLIAQALPQYPNLGCTLPGRWRRSLTDADWAVNRKLAVRVVKGQWADVAKPEIDARQGFLSVIDRLAGRARHVAVATHDAVLAREVLNRLLKAQTPCELELLYGLPLEPACRVAKMAGVAVRLYLPYGHGWLPYNLSQVHENPRILSWVLRDVWGRSADRSQAVECR